MNFREPRRHSRLHTPALAHDEDLARLAEMQRQVEIGEHSAQGAADAAMKKPIGGRIAPSPEIP